MSRFIPKECPWALKDDEWGEIFVGGGEEISLELRRRGRQTDHCARQFSISPSYLIALKRSCSGSGLLYYIFTKGKLLHSDIHQAQEAIQRGVKLPNGYRSSSYIMFSGSKRGHFRGQCCHFQKKYPLLTKGPMAGQLISLASTAFTKKRKECASLYTAELWEIPANQISSLDWTQVNRMIRDNPEEWWIGEGECEQQLIMVLSKMDGKLMQFSGWEDKELV